MLGFFKKMLNGRGSQDPAGVGQRATGLVGVVDDLDTESEAIKSAGLFDAEFYADSYQDVKTGDLKPWDHFLQFGKKEKRNIHPLFDTGYYTKCHKEVLDLPMHPILHYLQFGEKDGYKPNPLFDPVFYAKHYGDELAVLDGALAHYLHTGAKSGFKPSELFDPFFYVQSLAHKGILCDVERALPHFFESGATTQGSTHPLFDTAYYLATNNDLAVSNVNPLVHFLSSGGLEGRKPHPLFDCEFYVEQHPQLLETKENPLAHYLRCGAAEGGNPTAVFDGDYYRTRYADSLQECPNPLVHYVLKGAEQAFQPNSLFQPGYYVEQVAKTGAELAQADALTHYVATGAYEGFNPHPCFHSFYYLSRYKDVSDKKLNPLGHYLTVGHVERRNPNSIFNGSYYLSQLGDEEKPDENALSHYLAVGRHRGIAPSAEFSIASYDECNPHFNHQTKDPTQDFFERYSLPRSHFGSIYKNEWYSTEVPEVSIVVLSYNNAFFTADCLGALWEHTAGYHFEVIVSDNGSSKLDLDYLRKIDAPFRLIEIGVNRGFGEGNNIAVEKAKGKYVVFLNNDAIVKSGWLEPLIAPLKEATVGCTGAKLFYPDGRIQEAGSQVLPDGTTKRFGLNESSRSQEFNHNRAVDFCSGAALAFRLDDFEMVGGFDYRFDPAYYEDVDLCFKIRSMGMSAIYCADSQVFHNEHGSAKDQTLAPQIHHRIEINKKIFLQRWQDQLDGKPFQPIVAKSLPQIQPIEGHARAGIYTPFELSSGGGENFLFTCGSVLGGNQFTLVSKSLWSKLRIKNISRSFGFTLSDCDVVLETEQAQNQLDYFVALGNHVVPPIAAAGKKNLFICQFPFPYTKREWTNEEKARLGKYDVCIVYSKFVEQHLKAELAKQSIKPIPIEILNPPIRTIGRGTEPKKNMILHVGRFFSGEHEKKQMVLVDTFKRLFADGLQGFELHLAGGVQPGAKHYAYFDAIQQAARGFPIFVHPDISHEELMTLYRTASIYWHATGFGVSEQDSPWKHEHFGMTTVEAMSAGCIAICINSAGQREIITNGEDGYLWNTLDELCQKTKMVAVDLDPSELEKMRSSALRRSASFSLNSFAVNLRSIVKN